MLVVANLEVLIALLFAAWGVLFALLICAYARVLVALKAKRSSLFQSSFGYELTWIVVSMSALGSIFVVGFGFKIVEPWISSSTSKFVQLSPILAVVTGALSILIMLKMFGRKANEAA
jgi:hypothetical protein